jgi:hypothetical protein
MIYNRNRGLLVRMEGLEPPCLAALDPKSSASTNFATSAAQNLNRKGKSFLNKFHSLEKYFFDHRMAYFCV